MGQVVTFSQLPAKQIAGGIASAPVTGGEMKEMAAEFIKHAPSAIKTFRALRE